jgi:hypothetical protein
MGLLGDLTSMFSFLTGTGMGQTKLDQSPGSNLTFRGSGGYVYRYNPSNHTYTVVAGPNGMGAVIQPNTTAWNAVSYEAATGRPAINNVSVQNNTPPSGLAPDAQNPPEAASGSHNFFATLLSGLTGGGGGNAATAPFQGSGGYTYQRQSDGSYKILGGPNGAGAVVPPGSAAWNAINAEAPSGTGTGTGGGMQAVGVAAQAVAQYGPAIIGAIQTVVGNQRSSLSSLQSQLANAMGDYTKAKSRGDISKATELAYKIRGLQTQIAGQQAVASTAIQSLNSSAPQLPVQTTSTFSSWLPWILGGGLLLTVVGAVLAVKSRRSSSPSPIAQVA